MTITWTIEPHGVRALADGVVYEVAWRIRAEDAVAALVDDSIYGVTRLPDPPVIGFVPAAELTAPLLIAWVQEAIGAEEVAQAEAAALSALVRQVEPERITLPLGT